MEQKKSERESRGNRGWSSQARQQELDEADRFQVSMLSFTLSYTAGQCHKLAGVMPPARFEVAMLLSFVMLPINVV